MYEHIFENLVRIKNKIKKLKSYHFMKTVHWWIQGLSSSPPVFLINKIFKKDDKKKINSDAMAQTWWVNQFN